MQQGQGQDPMRVDVVRPNATFWKILAKAAQRPEERLKTELAGRSILGLDPGETTGVAIFTADVADTTDFKIRLMQLETKDVGQGYLELEGLVEEERPDHIRAEEYRVYSWKADSHSNQILHTPQLIGAIKVLSLLHGIPLSFKMAQHAKAFWNDDNLKACGLYSPGQKHARDALRHLLFYLTFPDKVD